MKVTCPTCSASGAIDETRLPPEGRRITCPRCGARFQAVPGRSAVEIIQQSNRMVCPGCSTEQPRSESCSACGAALREHAQNQARERELERLKAMQLKTEVHSVDAWYRNLFGNRLAVIIARALAMLVLACLFLTCSFRGAHQRRMVADMENPPGSKPPTPEQIGAAFREHFPPALELLAKNTDACISQDFNYYQSWYQQGQPAEMTQAMYDSLDAINRRRHEADTAFRKVPANSSARHQECYRQLQRLSETHRDACSLSNSYNTSLPNYHERVTNLLYDFNRSMEVLNGCRNSL